MKIEEAKKIKPKYYLYPGLTDERAEYIEARYKFNALLATACVFYKVKQQDVLGKSRRPVFVKARHMVMYFLNKQKGVPSTWIGDFLFRDHTTVLYALRQISGWVDVNDAIVDDISELTNILAESDW